MQTQTHPATTKKQRVDWTEEEKEKLITRVAELRLKKTQPALLSLVNEAQEEVFPADRRRNILAVTMLFPNFLERVQMRIDGLAKGPKPVEETEPEIMVVHVPQEIPIDQPKIVRETPTAELVSELMVRLFGEFEGVQSSLRKIAEKFPTPEIVVQSPAFRPPVIPRPSVPIAPCAAKPVKIGVVGLFKDQFHHAEKKLKDKLKEKNAELLFIDKDQKRAKTDVPISVDFMVVQRHTRHNVFEVARQHLGPERVAFASGGINDVVQKVYDLLSRQKK